MRSLGKGVMSATTQVKVLSPEIIPCCIGPRVTFLGSQYRYARNGECILDVPGSESVAGKRTVYILELGRTEAFPTEAAEELKK